MPCVGLEEGADSLAGRIIRKCLAMLHEVFNTRGNMFARIMISCNQALSK